MLIVSNNRNNAHFKLFVIKLNIIKHASKVFQK